MRNPFQELLLLLGVCIVAITCGTGCSEKRAAAVEGSLSETMKTAHAPLRDELGLLIASGDSPEQIAHEIYEHLNGRTSFLKAMTKLFEYIDTEPLLHRASRLIATDPPQLSAIDVEAIRELRVQYATQRAKINELLANDPPLGLSPHQAYVNDFEFLKAFDAAHALMLLTAVENVAARKPQDAIASIVDMLALCGKLEEVPIATTRVHAANMRHRTLRIAAKILELSATDRECYQSLFDLLQLQHARWVSAGDLLRGERAMGLMVYERVRQGEFLSLLPQDEYQRLKQEKMLEVTRRSVLRNIDLDETFFLLAIKSQLAAAVEPYYERLPALQELRERMTNLADSPEYPYVASKFLLHDLEQVQLALAQDRALLDAWMCLLQTAMAGTMPENVPINPVDGSPFQLSLETDRWFIRGLQSPDGEESISVPLLQN